MSSRAEYFLESLKREMVLRGVSTTELIQRSGLSANTVYKLLRKGARFLRRSSMDKLADAVGAPVLLMQADSCGGKACVSAEFDELCKRLRDSRNTDKHAAWLLILHMAYQLQKNHPVTYLLADSEAMAITIRGTYDITAGSKLCGRGLYEFYVDVKAPGAKEYVTENPRALYAALVNHMHRHNEHIT